MTYRETLAYLSGLNPLGIRFGLDAIRSLLGRLNDPQRSFPSVLIAGTNGKGSVAAMTASILSTAGFRTGLYTSPDLIDVRERIRIDGRMISREEMAFCVDEVRSRIREEVSYFEFLTAMAFLHFQRQKVDIAVLEVGMGGRLDATNVVDPTRLGDHQHLPRTPGVPRQHPGRNRARKGGDHPGGGSLPHRGPAEAGHRDPGGDLPGKRGKALPGGKGDPDDDPSGRDVFIPGHRASAMNGFVCPLAGKHQISNAALALGAVELIGDAGFRVEEAAVFEGLKQARWEGRLEILQRSPMLLVDGAHNPAGVATLCRALQNDFPHRRLILLFGVLGDKDYRTMAKRLFPLADRVILTRPEQRAGPVAGGAAAGGRKVSRGYRSGRKSGRCPALCPFACREGGSRLCGRLPLSGGRSQEAPAGSGKAAGRMPFLKTGNRIAVEGAEVNRLKKVFCFLAILFVPWMAASPLRAFETEFRGGTGHHRGGQHRLRWG